MIIKPDLHHRCRAAASQTLDHRHREFAVLGRLARMNAELRTYMIGNVRLSHDPARQCFAYLDVMTANLTQIEHRIKRRRFPDISHLEIQKLRQEINAWIVNP